MNPDVLFYDIANPDQANLIPAIAKLGLRPIVAGPLLARAAASAAIDFLRWEELAPTDVEAQARRELEARRSALVDALNRPEVRREFFTSAGDLWPIIAPNFGAEISRILIHQVSTLIHLETVRRKTNLTAIVLGCDNAPWQRAITMYARPLGIPTLQLAHGINPPTRAHHAGEMYTLFADHVAVFGPRAKQSLVDSGNDPDRIHITGAPHWDPLMKPEARIDAKHARQKLGLDPDKPTLLYFANYTGTASAYFALHHAQTRLLHDTFVRAAASLGPDLQVIIRPHPHELARVNSEQARWTTDAYKNHLALLGLPTARIITSHKIESIRAADLCLFGAESTAIPEVMLLKRPVVVLPWVAGQPILYTENDGITRLENIDELPSRLKKLLDSPDERERIVERQNTTLADLAYHQDARATDRVAELIHRLSAQSHRNKLSA